MDKSFALNIVWGMLGTSTEASLGPLVDLLGTSWVTLRTSRGILAADGRGALEALWGHVGGLGGGISSGECSQDEFEFPLVRPSWGPPGPSWGPLGPSWGSLGTLWVVLGRFFPLRNAQSTCIGTVLATAGNMHRRRGPATTAKPCAGERPLILLLGLILIILIML